jgi:hypothetical protein
MTPEERQALREKHHEWELHKGYCIACWQPYPCDVLDVLDEMEME